MSSIMKFLIITAILLVVCTFAFGQSVTTAGEPDPAEIGVDTAQQKLKEVLRKP